MQTARRASYWANARLTQGLERGRTPAFIRRLTVRGRVTGEPHATPVVPVIRDGDVWVVSPYSEVAWVSNVRRAGQLELLRGEERTLDEARELNAREATRCCRRTSRCPLIGSCAATSRSPSVRRTTRSRPKPTSTRSSRSRRSREGSIATTTPMAAGSPVRGGTLTELG